MRIRTLLYTPATRPDRFAKALGATAADVVAADLEDAVPKARKQEARAAICTVLAEHASRPGAVPAVRINAWPGATAEADIDACVAAGAQVLVVPKCEDPAALAQIHRRILAAETASGRMHHSVRVVAICETAAGVLAARELAQAPRVVALAFGAEDLAADVGFPRTPSNVEVSVARTLVSLAAAANGQGVQALDMVTVDVRDGERTRREMLEARALGYHGKMVIHPDQVAVVHEALRPDEAQIAWAKTILTHEAAVAESGVVRVGDWMVDEPLVRQAKRVLRDAGQQL